MKQLSYQSYAVPIFLAFLMHFVIAVMFWFPWPAWSTPAKVITPKYVNASLVKMAQPTIKKTPTKPVKKTSKKTSSPKQKPPPVAKKKIPMVRAQKKTKPPVKKPVVATKPKPTDKKTRTEKNAALETEKAKQLAREKQRRERQKLQELALLEALASEQMMLEEQQGEQQARSFYQLIKEAIEQSWSRPLSARNGMEVLLKISLVPTGEVAQVSVANSSGDAAFDRSTVVAVKAASPFEVPQDSRQFEKYFREISMRFKPEDLPN